MKKNITEKQKLLGFKIKAACKNQKQKELVKAIYDHEITFTTGISGSGKSFVSLMTALKLLKDPETPYKRIVLIYPVELCSEENLGFLKGTLEEKLEPYSEVDLYTLEKIITESGQSGKEVIKKMREEGLIEIRTAAFLRGATLDDSIVIISEAQNFSKDTFLKILTRIGTNSKYIFNADEAQVDASTIKKGKVQGGLRYAIDKLTGLQEIGHVCFGSGDVVRNPVISKILKLWDPDRYGDNENKEGL